MTIEIDETLESDLADVINRHISTKGLTPQVAAATMTGMTIDFLDYLSWKPQSVQCAEIYLNEAKSWLQDGAGTPVLSHESGGADRNVLNSLVSNVGKS